MNLFSLEGKTALVTGCKRGIGFAMAQALAQAGADIIGVSASLKPNSDIEQEVVKTGRNFKAYQCDFSDRKDLYSFIEKVKAENKKIDILVNNAGTIMRNPAAEHSDEYWDKVIEVNQNSSLSSPGRSGRK
jgi:2-dehydro-3-deoxy-D-gluconate 5-dehydrogenase